MATKMYGYGSLYDDTCKFQILLNIIYHDIIVKNGFVNNRSKNMHTANLNLVFFSFRMIILLKFGLSNNFLQNELKTPQFYVSVVYSTSLQVKYQEVQPMETCWSYDEYYDMDSYLQLCTARSGEQSGACWVSDNPQNIISRETLHI